MKNKGKKQEAVVKPSEKVKDLPNGLAPENVYSELFDQAREKLKDLERSKQDVIIDLANKLEAQEY